MQVIINSLIEASELGLLAIGLTLVYDLLGFPNFAQITFGTLGAYICYAVTSDAVGVIPAACLAIILTGFFGVLVNYLIFRKLSKKGDVILMIASFGLAIVMKSIILAIWGANPQSYPTPIEPSISILGGRITQIELLIIGVTIACIVAFHLLLTRTRLGTAIRATSDNDVLAEASGIETSRIIALVWFIGSALGGLGGIMLAADTQLSPTMGTGILIPVFAAAILGGLGSPYGAIAGAVVVAFAENIALSINWAPIVHDIGMTHLAYLSIPTGYGKAAPFLLLVFILIFRPRGIFSGSKS